MKKDKAFITDANTQPDAKQKIQTQQPLQQHSKRKVRAYITVAQPRLVLLQVEFWCAYKRCFPSDQALYDSHSIV
jgi:hypothetical protein